MRLGSAATVLLCLAAGVAGCGGSGRSATTTRSSTPSTPTVSVTKTQTVTTAAASASGPDGVPYCSPKDLGIHYVGGGGAAGTLLTTFAFVNVTARTCRLDGYPGVSMLTATGRRIPLPVDRNGGDRARQVRVKPGGRVNFTFAAGDGAVGPCYRAAIFRFIPPNDYAYEQIAYHRVMCGKAAFVSAVGDAY